MMEKETAEMLRTVAYVLKENGCEHLMDKIGECDYQMAQVLEMFMRKD